MTPAERLDAIDDRYGEWYAEHPEDYMGPAASWDERDPGETAEHCIVRNDVPWLLDLARRQDAALRAVLDLCATADERCDMGDVDDGDIIYSGTVVLTGHLRDAIRSAQDGAS